MQLANEKMTDREQMAVGAGAGAGGVAGFAAVRRILSTAGGVAGVSASGLTNALAAIGVGGMRGGIMTVAALPVGCIVAGAALTYGGCRIRRRLRQRRR